MTLTPEKFVSSYLLYLLAASSEAASHQFHLRVRELGLRVPEWRVLACLYDQDGLMIAGQKLSSEVVEEAREHERTLLSALNQSDADRIKPSLERLLASLNSWNSANE